MLSTEIPSTKTKHGMQKLPETLHLSRTQSAFVPTLRDCLAVAMISLVILVFSSVLMLGASNILHARTIGWIATLVVIIFGIIIINLIMLLSYTHSKRFHGRATS